MKRILKMLVVSGLMVFTTLSVWITAYAGSWQKTNYGWWYQNNDGTYPTNQWFQDTDGRWYHFNSDGYMQFGWLNDNGKWYYLSESGSMIRDTWKQIDGESYYFGSDGAMYVSTTTPDGKKVDENGVKINTTNIPIDDSQYIGIYGIKDFADNGSAEESKGGVVEITKITTDKIYGTFYERADASDSGCKIDFSSGVALNNSTFIAKGEDYWRKWDEDRYRTADYSIKFQLDMIGGRPIIRGLEGTGGLDPFGSGAFSWGGGTTYYKVLD